MAQRLAIPRNPVSVIKYAPTTGPGEDTPPAAPEAAPAAHLSAGRMLIKKLVQMGFWRAASIVAAAGSAVWAARCLGPEKLGISGMTTAYAAQASLLVQFGLTPQLVRDYNFDLNDSEGNERLVSEALSYRICCAIGLSIAWVVIACCVGLPAEWRLATAMGIVTLIAGAATCDWLLQAQENQVAQQRMAAIGAGTSALLSFSLLRPGAPAGSDLAIVAFVTTLVGFLMWRAATLGRHRPSISLQAARRGMNRLWRGRWLFLSAVLIYCYTRFELPLLGWFRSVGELGRYRSAQQIVGAVQPLLALVPALLYPRMIVWSKRGPDNLWEKQLSLAKMLTLIAIPGIIGAFAIIPLVYPRIFGPQFRDAAWPCCLLVSSKFFVLLNGIFGWGLWALGRDRTMLVIMSITAGISLLMNLLLIPKFGMLAASGMNVFSEAMILAACMFVSHRIASQHSKETFDLAATEANPEI